MTTNKMPKFRKRRWPNITTENLAVAERMLTIERAGFSESPEFEALAKRRTELASESDDPEGFLMVLKTARGRLPGGTIFRNPPYEKIVNEMINLELAGEYNERYAELDAEKVSIEKDLYDAGWNHMDAIQNEEDAVKLALKQQDPAQVPSSVRTDHIPA